jgi:hypothetical protein
LLYLLVYVTFFILFLLSLSPQDHTVSSDLLTLILDFVSPGSTRRQQQWQQQWQQQKIEIGLLKAKGNPMSMRLKRELREEEEKKKVSFSNFE